MSENKKNIEGGCLCSAIRYQVAGTSKRTTHCHCNHCRKSSGAAFITWTAFNIRKFNVITGHPASYSSRENVIRQFCSNCGTQLTFYDADNPEYIDITVCSLDDSTTIIPEDHIWCERMVPWLNINDGLNQYNFGRYEH